ncbi:hypothetical protein Ancab_019577 [Ancistrocladus abbreviatus]
MNNTPIESAKAMEITRNASVAVAKKHSLWAKDEELETTELTGREASIRGDSVRETRQDESDSRTVRQRRRGVDLFSKNQDTSVGRKLDFLPSDEDLVKLEDEDVSEEVEYQSCALIGYALREKVPCGAMSNYVKLRWKHVGEPEPKTVRQAYALARLYEPARLTMGTFQPAKAFGSSAPKSVRQGPVLAFPRLDDKPSNSSFDRGKLAPKVNKAPLLLTPVGMAPTQLIPNVL